MALTQERLREVLSYDAETGAFRWLKRNARRLQIGDEAGANSRGYVVIGIDGRLYAAHRLAWLYVTGEWPSEIDHVNCQKNDNRFVNLRIATRQQQQANHRVRRTSKSGIKGVRQRCDLKGWTARITHKGRPRHLGSFKTKEEASAAYFKAAQELFGQFARY